MQNYMTARMFAREYGTMLGGAWTIMFGGAMASIRTGSGLGTILMLVAALACIVLPFYFASRYKNKPFNGESGISYFHALYFSFIMFFYASMISAAVTFIYFQWMDDGAFIDSIYAAIAEIEKGKDSLPPGMTEMLEKEKDMINQIAGIQIKPIEQALGMFNQGLISGLIVSVVTALFAKREPDSTPPPIP